MPIVLDRAVVPTLWLVIRFLNARRIGNLRSKDKTERVPTDDVVREVVKVLHKR